MATAELLLSLAMAARERESGTRVTRRERVTSGSKGSGIFVYQTVSGPH